MMFHQQMADYYEFLNLCDYKKIHEERFIEESRSLRELHCYYISHYGKLIPQKRVDDPEAIPQSWQRYSMDEVGKSDREKFAVNGFEKWISWEKDTRDILKKCYKELENNGEYASSCMVLDRINDVEDEIVCARKMYMTIKG